MVFYEKKKKHQGRIQNRDFDIEAGQLGLTPSLPLSQLGPSSTQPLSQLGPWSTRPLVNSASSIQPVVL